VVPLLSWRVVVEANPRAPAPPPRLHNPGAAIFGSVMTLPLAILVGLLVPLNLMETAGLWAFGVAGAFTVACRPKAGRK
jgi:hypothetical protein